MSNSRRDWFDSEWNFRNIVARTKDGQGREMDIVQITSDSFDSIKTMDDMKKWIDINSGAYSTYEQWWEKIWDKLDIKDHHQLQVSIIKDKETERRWYRFAIFWQNSEVDIEIPILSPSVYFSNAEAFQGIDSNE